MRKIALVILVAALTITPQLLASNIITFGDNATACGGSVLCSTNGTLGYNGTVAFNLSTINQWFQVAGTSLLAGQTSIQTMNAGQFRVFNDTGGTVSTFSLTLTDTFTSSTASAGPCPTDHTKVCDNFQANKGAGAPSGASEALSGSSFMNCTNGSAGGGFLCYSTAGQAAGNFSPGTVIFTWSGLNIGNHTYFDIGFSSWNNAAYATTPEPAGLVLLGAGIAALVGLTRRKARM